MTRTTPWWLGWIAESLSIAPGDQLLEVGCGGGTLTSLVCDQLTSGRITAIDRSAAAIATASARNAAHVNAGKAVFHQLELADVDWAGQRFDKILAVNVSALWIGSADAEWDRVLRQLRDTGSVRLFHRSTTTGRTAQVAAAIAGAMAGHGLVSVASFDATRTICGVIGVLPA
jgi:cyclopropane fatty-acyl-phospholipid synthase-like methyltransferase